VLAYDELEVLVTREAERVSFRRVQLAGPGQHQTFDARITFPVNSLNDSRPRHALEGADHLVNGE